MIFTIILIHLLMLLPIYGEGVFDKLVWRFKWFKGNDKPFSTWVVRPILFITGGYFAWRLGNKELWRVGVVMFFAFLAWFPIFINLLRPKISICDLGTDWWDNLLRKYLPHCAVRLWLFIWLWMLAMCIYYYYELKLATYGY